MIEQFQQIHAYVFDPDRLPVAIMAMILVTALGLVTGPGGGNVYPLLWRFIDLLFGKLGAKMDKPGRPRGDLIFRGFIITVCTVVICFLLGNYAQILADHYRQWQITEILALSIVLSAGTGFFALLRLYNVLEKDKAIKGAYFAIARSARTDLTRSDNYTITRVGMGLGAKAFDKGLVAPIVWYLIGGLPGAYIYAGLSAVSWRFGKEGFSRGFGDSALALEKLFGFVPNVFAGLLIAFGGLFTPTAMFSRAIFGWGSKKGRAPYAEGGLPMTSMAWGLNVSLGGPVTDLEGSAIKQGWIGPAKATAQLQAKHLHRAIYILGMAHLLLFAGLIVSIVIGGHSILPSLLDF